MTVRAIAVILFCFIVANGQGTYTNPIIDADYSDPDVIRVGDDFLSHWRTEPLARPEPAASETTGAPVYGNNFD